MDRGRGRRGLQRPAVELQRLCGRTSRRSKHPSIDRRGQPRTSISKKNQPRRPNLRPRRGARVNPPVCFQVPRTRKRLLRKSTIRAAYAGLILICFACVVSFRMHGCCICLHRQERRRSIHRRALSRSNNHILKTTRTGPIFLAARDRSLDPRDPLTSPRQALHNNLYEKSALQRNSKATSRHPKSPAKLPASTPRQHSPSSSRGQQEPPLAGSGPTRVGCTR